MDSQVIRRWLSGDGSGSGEGWGSGEGSGEGSGWGSGEGSGWGSGEGSGSGWGWGSGSGSGEGEGSGEGSGSGSGSGSGEGSGEGSGSGWGSGSGSGEGEGSGSGSGVICKLHNGNEVFYIDGVPTVILSIHNNYAKGYIISASDFTVTNCYIAKGNGYFAHGATLRDTASALSQKIIKNMNIDDRIAEFCKTFEKEKAYTGAVFFDWHNRLTGSCLLGRQQFFADHGLSMDGLYTVDDFIALTKNAYGGEIIKKLKIKWRSLWN